MMLNFDSHQISLCIIIINTAREKINTLCAFKTNQVTRVRVSLVLFIKDSIVQI